MHRALFALLFLAACAPPPAANPEFSDAAAFAFIEFDSDRPEDLAFALRNFEQQLYLSVDVDAEASADRAVAPENLTDEQLETLDHPDRPAAGLLGVGVIKPSLHDVAAHTGYILLDDQVPVEPSSPDHYDRTFTEGRDCWPTQNCEFLRTDNDLTKDNFLLTITYRLFKDYRWIDLGLPDPADVPPGEDAVNPGEPRWALAGRSWTTEEAVGEQGNSTIQQSYSIEVWLPRDGGGFVRDGSETNEDGGEWTGDSTGGGVLRSMVLWSETDLGADVDDTLVINTTRGGIDDIFDVQEEWMDAQ
jgi:hypothetical protein